MFIIHLPLLIANVGFLVYICCFFFFCIIHVICFDRRFLGVAKNAFSLHFAMIFTSFAEHATFLFDFQLTFIYAFVLFATFFKHTLFSYRLVWCRIHLTFYIFHFFFNFYIFKLYFHFKLSAVLSIKPTTTNSKYC